MPLGFAKSVFGYQAPAAVGGGHLEAVTFDGTNDYSVNSSGLTVTDGKQGTVSVWCRRTSTNNMIVFSNSANPGTIVGSFYCQMSAAGYVLIQGRDSSNTECLALTNGVGDNINQWNHILASWDLANNLAYMYVNDSTTGNDVNNKVNQNIKYNAYAGSGEWSVGAGIDDTNGIYQKFEGDIGTLYFTDEYIDITQVSNRRKFINADGTPVNLGSDGSTPTGTAARLLMAGDATYWNNGTNSGTGGSFSMTGSVTDSTNEPIDAI